MKMHRIWAMVLRYLCAWFRNINNFIDDALWPILDIVLWGMTSLWIKSDESGVSTTVLTLLSCLVLWYVVQRANDAVSMNALEELWERNFTNLFSTPLTIYEWMTAIILLSLARIAYTLIICTAVVWLFYAFNIFSIGMDIIPFLFLLLLSGLFIGFFSTAFVMCWGRKALFFAWTVSWLFSPFSGVYYPLDVLPTWAQKIGRALPMSYAFAGIREILTHQIFPTDTFLISLGLNCLYLVISILFFVYMFERSRIKGFTTLQ
jgi:ABC-2 type transport system permease protein